MDKEDGGAMGPGARSRVEEVVAVGLEVGVGGVDVCDFEGEVGEGGAGLAELAGYGAIGGEGGEDLEGGMEKDFADLIGAEDVFAVQFLEA